MMKWSGEDIVMKMEKNTIQYDFQVIKYFRNTTLQNILKCG